MSGLGGEPYYFRDCCIRARAPHRAFAASVAWHVAFVVLVVPLSRYIPVPPRTVLPRVEITWYGPIHDLPLMAPRARVSAPRAPAGAPRPVSKPEKAPAPQPGADAFHPRQTIVNAPMRPNHPRQTLIQPAAPPVPPTILPTLPNIVEWATPSEPQAPRIDPETLRLKRPKAAERVPRREIEAPEAPKLEQPLGPIDIVASAATKPALPVEAMSAPRARVRQTAEVAAPEIPAAPESGQLIALSAAPGPERPPEIPPGNLSARLAISPEAVPPSAAAAQPDTAPSGAGNGPPGLSISGGGKTASNISGAGRGLRVMPGMPGRPAASPAAGSPAVVASRTQPNSLLDRIQPGMEPEGLLGPKRIYTLRFSMPNLSSATGSWVLSFTELVTLTAQPTGSAELEELSGPTALRKVDPKYPPELRDGHVEGEVILYAVIRADGTVDSIQLVKGIDPTLDANAMQALAQWKFRPAERRGVPVDIETVVRIPFRAVAPVY
jgi:TonB family protein